MNRKIVTIAGISLATVALGAVSIGVSTNAEANHQAVYTNGQNIILNPGEEGTYLLGCGSSNEFSVSGGVQLVDPYLPEGATNTPGDSLVIKESYASVRASDNRSSWTITVQADPNNTSILGVNVEVVCLRPHDV